MGVLDETRKMLQEGHTEQEVIGSLIGRGFTMAEISDAMSQSKIKEAIGGEISDSSQMTREDTNPQRMQPSLMASESSQGQEDSAPGQVEQSSEVAYGNAPPTQNAYPQNQQYQQQAYADYPEYQQQSEFQQQPGQYQAYAPQSADLTGEIVEQVVAEKLSPLRNRIESLLDLKSSMTSKIESVDERLKRIEKIIDRLQLSILQKVGEYITNVEDIKKEIVETQKTVKSIHHKTSK